MLSSGETVVLYLPFTYTWQVSSSELSIVNPRIAPQAVPTELISAAMESGMNDASRTHFMTVSFEASGRCPTPDLDRRSTQERRRSASGFNMGGWFATRKPWTFRGVFAASSFAPSRPIRALDYSGAVPRHENATRRANPDLAAARVLLDDRGIMKPMLLGTALSLGVVFIAGCGARSAALDPEVAAGSGGENVGGAGSGSGITSGVGTGGAGAGPSGTTSVSTSVRLRQRRSDLPEGLLRGARRGGLRAPGRSRVQRDQLPGALRLTTRPLSRPWRRPPPDSAHHGQRLPA